MVLLRIVAEVELLLAEVEEPVVLTVAEQRGALQDDLLNDVHGLVVEALVEDGAVIDTGQGDRGVDEVGHAAFEERRQIVGIGAVDLFLPAVVHEVDKGFDRGAAEGVAVEVDLLVRFGLAEVFESTGIGAAEPFVVVLLAVDFAVVDTGAGELGIQFTGAVPGGALGVDGGGIAVEAHVVQGEERVAVEHAPVGQAFVLVIVAAPAGEAVAEDPGVVGLPAVRVRCRDVLCRVGPGTAADEQDHGERHEERHSFRDVFFHCGTSPELFELVHRDDLEEFVVVREQVVDGVFREDAALEVGGEQAGFVVFEVFPPATAFVVVLEGDDLVLCLHEVLECARDVLHGLFRVVQVLLHLLDAFELLVLFAGTCFRLFGAAFDDFHGRSSFKYKKKVLRVL